MPTGVRPITVRRADLVWMCCVIIVSPCAQRPPDRTPPHRAAGGIANPRSDGFSSPSPDQAGRYDARAMAHTETLRAAPPWGGTVEPGFEPVRDAFVAGLDAFGDGGGALVAYTDGKLVVDLWGGNAREGEAWQHDTPTVIWSTTKALVTLCAQILFDRGRLDLDAPVAEYWPEFAAAGKERVRVRHILSHTSGVLAPVDMDTILSWRGDGWSDYDRIAAGLAAAAPAVTPGATFAYQAFSFGWLIGELVRRITGDSIGTFFP